MSTRSSAILASSVLLALLVTSLATVAAAASDTTPPKLVSLTVTPNQVDVSTSSQDVTVTAVITDDLSGVSYSGDATPGDVSSYVYLLSPSGNQTIGLNGFTLVSGDTYASTMTVPQYAEQGIWRDWVVYLTDEVGNYVWLYEDDLISAGVNEAVGVDPFDTSYARTITLRLSRTRASGYVAAELESACFWYVPVVLERKTTSGWKRVGSTLSLYDGYYRVGISKAGRYRATATEFGTGTPSLTTCLTAAVARRLS